MFHLKELWSNSFLIILRPCLACTLGPVLDLTTEKGYCSYGSFPMGNNAHVYPSWAPYHCLSSQRLNLLMCTLVSGDLLGLVTCLLDLHHKFFPLGPVFALFWFHSRTWHFILLLVSLSHLPRTETSVLF